MEYVAAAKTDVGRKRTGNEDNHCLAPDLGLFVVCDGMGGHAAGEVASRLGVETIRESLAKYLRGEKTDLVGRPMDNCSPESSYLVSSIQLANRAIFQAATTQREYLGMGTTVVAVLALDDRVALAHVGDSRIYRIRGGKIAQVSKDHSLVQMQVDKGLMTPEEAHESQYRHMITRALGLKETVEVDLQEQPVEPGDILLLCSDGLSDLVADEEMLATVQEHAQDLEGACQALVDRANSKGGDDNITAVLIQASMGAKKAPEKAGTPPTMEDTLVLTAKPPRMEEPRPPRGVWGRIKNWLLG